MMKMKMKTKMIDLFVAVVVVETDQVDIVVANFPVVKAHVEKIQLAVVETGVERSYP